MPGVRVRLDGAPVGVYLLVAAHPGASCPWEGLGHGHFLCPWEGLGHGHFLCPWEGLGHDHFLCPWEGLGHGLVFRSVGFVLPFENGQGMHLGSCCCSP